MNVKWNGREVQNPILRKLVVLLVIVWIPVGLAGALLGFLVCLVLLPVTLPLDVVLKGLGRRGFFVQEGQHLSYKINPAAFRSIL